MALSDDQRFAMYTAEEIGNAIKKRRRQLKITQKEFAQRLDKSERTIQKYESGEITMKIDLIKQVADELDIPWQELLEAKSDKIGIVSAEEDFPSYRFHNLSDVINALFAITEIKDIAFQLSCTKPPENPEWTSALMVDGKGSGTYNADFCLFMENWMNKLAALQSGSISQEDMLNILENQQYQLEQLKTANLEQQELLEKLNAENRRLSAENLILTVQNQKLAAQNRQLQELCKE